jgi:hypothetical protein
MLAMLPEYVMPDNMGLVKVPINATGADAVL